MNKISIENIALPVLLFMAVSCGRMQQYSVSDDALQLFPDYSGVVVPCNIAPLNFRIDGDAGKYMARFAAGDDSFDVYCSNTVDIPKNKWRKLLSANSGGKLNISIFAKEKTGWTKHPDITLSIATEQVDPYLAYRLIEPGYKYWGKMGIYQRHLESFDETPVMLNTLTDGGCVNCHSFCNNDPEKMLFHLRAQYAGTILLNEGKLTRLNTKTSGKAIAAVYPRWHPGGRYIAFSVNSTSQVFHSVNKNLIEVYDSESDLIIYDVETQTVSTSPLIHSKDRFETFPEWSPDGKSLFFCSAPAMEMPDNYDSLRYDLFRIDFDPATGVAGNKIDTVLLPSKIRKSVAFPRISPDGNYLLVCLSDYGTFPIWHRENDLYLLDLQSGSLNPLSEVNSKESDSYHSWSSNGRWIVFGSRRMDGLYTRPYIAYFDKQGAFHKPFLLPQRNPLFYDELVKSYNIPEFVTGKIKTDIRALERVAKQ
ncbi:MAG: hypothetical protein LBT50_04215 [Prevotellaceae bacterium]|jgi:hypothetical protein|nr:hypothetical protein [Prevotellaceae bacterium]